jgi:hypothetical protein
MVITLAYFCDILAFKGVGINRKRHVGGRIQLRKESINENNVLVKCTEAKGVEADGYTKAVMIF